MEYTKDEKAIIWLDSFNGLEYKHKYSLIFEQAKYPYEIVENFEKFKKFIINVAGESTYNNIKSTLKSKDYFLSVISELNKYDTLAVTLFSKNYPENLKNSQTPPIVLYCRGNVKLLNDKKFAIVGSRKTLPNIQKRIEEFSEKLSSNFTIITGLAEGADSSAIKGALKSGNIISVLAYGYDFVYPASNRDLLDKIIKNGLVITEHINSIAPQKYLFPIRNRIIAYLSEGVLVASGGEKSGAKITANYALDCGIPTFAFPYSFGVSSGVGCNDLIKKGAQLCDNILDITDYYGLNLTEKVCEKEFSETQNKILELLRQGENHFSRLSEILKLDKTELMTELSMLEIEGKIARLGGNRYGLV